jgi:hypothetical protein
LDYADAAAHARTGNLRVWREPVSDIASQVTEPVHGNKTLVDDDSDAILGAHPLGRAPRWSSTCSLAVWHNLGARQMQDTVCAYQPTASDVG